MTSKMRETGHLFDFTADAPYTSDPRYAGRLKTGPHNKVMLNGKDVGGRVTQFMTGKAGWVERLKEDEDGNVVLSEDQDIEREILHGEVEYVWGGDEA